MLSKLHTPDVGPGVGGWRSRDSRETTGTRWPLRRASRAPVAPAHDVKDHAVVTGIVAVAVGVPVPLTYVDLDVAPYQADTLELEHRITEVGAGASTDPSRIDHPKASSVPRFEGRLAAPPYASTAAPGGFQGSA